MEEFFNKLKSNPLSIGLVLLGLGIGILVRNLLVGLIFGAAFGYISIWYIERNKDESDRT